MKRIPAKLWLTCLLVLLCLILAGCSDPNTSYIQGRWASGNVHYWSEWYFDRGYFSFFSTIDIHGNTSEKTGSYRIVASDGDLITLELYNTDLGDPLEDTTQLAIKINRDEGSLRIGRGTFYAVSSFDLDEVTLSPTP